ncbi:MAG: hypothetical protein M1826_004540 [Phylliscum demangeonii]|nr:MAG: hypothetical protein M1826_004540 [Phylliscum demangeonii]
MGMTAGVVALLYFDVFSPDSKTSHFNRAVDRVKNDARCIELLGDRKRIMAYGQPSAGRLVRNRPLASTASTDRNGVEHLVMRFHVEGPRNKGTVHLHLTKRPDQRALECRYLALDVRGHARIVLEEADAVADADAITTKPKQGVRLLGIRWT